MIVLDLKKIPQNIQKCLLPDCEFLRENYGRYCIVIQKNHKFIVKIGLSEVKNIHETMLLDLSVTMFSSLEKTKRTECLNDITFKNFLVINKPRIAKIVKVTIVFADFLNVKYRNTQSLSTVVKDILKLFVFCCSSFVSLCNLLENQKFGINSIIIMDIDSSKHNECFKVDSNTKIIIEKCLSQLKLDQSQEKDNLVQIGGCKRVYGVLKETVDFSKSLRTKGVKFVNKLLLIGPPGCGKTSIMHNIARNCSCVLLEISASDINTLTSKELEKKLLSVFDEAKAYAEQKECCVILIKDIDLMSSGRSLHAKKFVGYLIILLEDVDEVPGIIVVATTDSPDEVNVELRRPKRLEDELEIMIPTAEERVEILEKILQHCKIKFNSLLLHQVSHWTPGFVGADLKLLVVEALIIYNKKGSILSVDQYLLKDCFKKALSKVIPSALRGTIGLCTTNTMSFLQIGGLEEIKKILEFSVKLQLANPEKFKKFGIPLTKGILLYGPPGCAKTTLVKALAKECKTTFLATSAADLYSPFVGDAEKEIVLLFSQARVGSPSILFIDEIDAVVGSKSSGREHGVQERILSTLLMEMDGVGLKMNTQRGNSLSLLEDEKGDRKEVNSSVIVIGATNRPQLLDDALKRPGRFDRLLYVPPPDELERFRILKKLTEKMSLDGSVDLNRLAKLTNFYSGADLKNLCQETGLHALVSSNMKADCIQQFHFEHILNDYKPSLSKKIINFYESFQKFNA